MDLYSKKIASEGEVLGAGAVVATLINPDDLIPKDVCRYGRELKDKSRG